MIIRYKIITKDYTTFNNFKWEVNKWYKADGSGELCSKGWLHCYCDPLLAVLHNPIHGGYRDYILCEVEVDGECKTDRQLKEGWTKMRVIKKIDIPEITLTQKIAYSLLCVLEVYKDTDFIEWAKNWLNGGDRSADAAARSAAWAAARSARSADAAAWAAARAAEAADAAARSAAWAAARSAARSARSAWAAEAADAAARSAARSADAAAEAAEIDLISLAKKALETKS